MRAVVDFIDEHLDEDLTVDQLSEVANFSKFHFHRQFRYATGFAVMQLIQLKRLIRASYQLVTDRQSITNIALTAGFENSESFSRAFKKTFQQTPSEFKRQPFSQPWLERTHLPQLGGSHLMQVKIIDFPETKIAVLQHCGPIPEKMQTVAKFIEWRKANGYSPDNSATYNILHNDPDSTSPEIYRFDVGGAVEKEAKPNPQGVVNGTIPAGRCAVVRHLGSSDNIEISVRYLYRDWLPESGEELRDYPCFLHRVVLPSQASAKDVITDVYLPLK
jgi:AraC family transcriptional regulator